MLKQNRQLGGRGVCVPLVWHRCWCHQSSDPTAKTLSGPGPGGIFRNSPSSRFPSGPIPAPEAAPGDPQPHPSPSPPRGVGLQVLLPRVFWGQIPAFLGWERAGKQPQALSSKEGFLLGCIFPSFSWDFSFFPLFPRLDGAEGTFAHTDTPTMSVPPSLHPTPAAGTWQDGDLRLSWLRGSK